jgi:hypothetical protein
MPIKMPVRDEDLDVVAHFNIRLYPGYEGVFTRDEAPGAIPNGTRIVKVWSENDKETPVGTNGTVLGSISHPNVGLAYFIEWDSRPRQAVLNVEKKIGLPT